MAWYSPLLDPATLFGTTGGGGLLGFVVGQAKARSARISKLETEVAECRARDADWKLLRVGMQVMVEETRRERPDSPALKTMGDLLGQAFGPPPTIAEFKGLLEQADDAEEKGED